MIQVLQPVVGAAEAQRVASVLESKWLGKGQEVSAFVTEFARRLNEGPKRFVSTTCGTEAIFLATDLFEFQAGDEILVPSISFVAVGNSVVAKQAQLVLCDVDRHSLNVRAADLDRHITRKTKAVILTHYGGVPCDMDPILDLCRDRNVRVIEDSAGAMNSWYKGKACGTLGDMGVWSFEAGKLITTGDGGMVYLKSEELARIAEEQLYLGLQGSEKSGMDRATSGNANWWEVHIERPGRRAVMNNIAAAIGLAQLERMDQFIARRRAIDERYRAELAACSWLALPPRTAAHSESSYYFFWIQFERRDALARYLLERGIYSTFRYWPLHRVHYFRQANAQCPNADYASRHTLNLPLHHGLSDDEVSRVIEAVKQFGATI